MAMQILPRARTSMDLISTGLGSGLSRGLQMLAEQKVGQLAKREQNTRTRGALGNLGIDPKIAQAVSELPLHLQQAYIKNMSGQSQDTALQKALDGLGIQQEDPQSQAIDPQSQAIDPQSQARDQQYQAIEPQGQARDLGTLFGGGGLNPQQKIQLAQMQQQKQLAEQKLKQQRDLTERNIGAKKQVVDIKRVDDKLISLTEKSDSAKQIIPSLKGYKAALESGKGSAPAINAAALWFGKELFGKDAEVDWLLDSTSQLQRKYSSDIILKELKEQKRPTKHLLKRLSMANPNIFTDPQVQNTVLGIKMFNREYEIAEDRIAKEIAAGNPDISFRKFNKQLDDSMETREKELASQYLPQLAKHKVGQVVESLPSPLQAPIGAEYADGEYIKRNTGTQWKIVRRNPEWSGK